MNMVIRIPLREYFKGALKSTANSKHLFLKFTPFGTTMKCYYHLLGVSCVPGTVTEAAHTFPFLPKSYRAGNYYSHSGRTGT